MKKGMAMALGMAALAAQMGNDMPIDSPKVDHYKKQTILTNKQKKVRRKNKLARKSRKINRHS